MTNYSPDFVIKLALILLLSSLPSLVYLVIFCKAKERWRMRLRRSQILANYPQRNHRALSHQDLYRNQSLRRGFADRDREDSSVNSHRRPVTKYFIGDTTCVHNAHSPYLRCAINPCGPCDECPHYEKQKRSS